MKMKLESMFLNEQSEKKIIKENAAIIQIITQFLQTPEGQKIVSDLLRQTLGGKAPGSIGSSVSKIGSSVGGMGR